MKWEGEIFWRGLRPLQAALPTRHWVIMSGGEGQEPANIVPPPTPLNQVLNFFDCGRGLGGGSSPRPLIHLMIMKGNAAEFPAPLQRMETDWEYILVPLKPGGQEGAQPPPSYFPLPLL